MTNSDLAERAARLAKLTEAADEARLDLKAAYDAAASQGYSKSALRKAVKVHMLDAKKRAKHDQEQMDLEIYLAEIEGRQLREAAPHERGHRQ